VVDIDTLLVEGWVGVEVVVVRLAVSDGVSSWV
jgi:hypothetical protein